MLCFYGLLIKEKIKGILLWNVVRLYVLGVVLQLHIGFGFYFYLAM